MKKDSFFIFWSTISLLFIVSLLVFQVVILLSPTSLRVQFTPDDTYYYLQLAKNFVKFDYWTFDSGVSTATGFHPLLAYILVLVYFLFKPTLEAFVIDAVVISAALAFILALCVWVKGIKEKNSYIVLFVAVFVGARSFLFNSVTGVEWSLVIILSALYYFTFYQSTESHKAAITLFFLGLLLSLARSDTGLLPFFIFMVSALLSLFREDRNKFALQISFIGLTGSVFGVALVFLNNLAFTGNLIQSSARMKSYWTKFAVLPWFEPVVTLMRTIGFDIYLKIGFFTALDILIIFLAAIFLLCLSAFREDRRAIHAKIHGLSKGNLNQLTLALASGLCVIAYIALYTIDAAIQIWYTANFIVPMFIVCVSVASCLEKATIVTRKLARSIFSFAALATILLNVIFTYPVRLHTPWPHQQITLAAGRYLSQHALDGRIGAWNAGIIGYYQGGSIVNIDGLVNDNVYNYAIRNELPKYLEQNDIVYIIDFDLMFNEMFSKRGGYDDPVFLKTLKPLIRFDDGQYLPWKNLTLYRVGN